MGFFPERDDEAGDIRIREDPLEGRLGVGIPFVSRPEQTPVFGPAQRLHGDDADITRGSSLNDLPELGPGPVVVGEHHDVKAITVDGRVGDFHQVGRMRRNAQKARLPLLLQAVEGLMGIFVEQPLHAIAGMNMDQIHSIGLQPLQAGVDGLHIFFNRMPGPQVAGWPTEFAGQKDLVPGTLDGFSKAVFGIGAAIVRRGIEIVHAPFDCLAQDFNGLASSRSRARTE